MTTHRGLLDNYSALIGATLFLLSLSVWSWFSIAKHAPRGTINGFGLANIFCYLALSFIMASVAYRSPIWPDRIVFGLVAGSGLLITIKAIIPLTQLGMLTVNIAKSSMWTIAASVCLILVVRSHPAERGKRGDGKAGKDGSP